MSTLGFSESDPLFAEANQMAENTISTKYDYIKNTTGYNSLYEPVGHETSDAMSNANFAEYARGFNKESGLTSLGRYKYWFNFAWDPISYFVLGRVFRRSWHHYHTYDKPSLEIEVRNLRAVVKQAQLSSTALK